MNCEAMQLPGGGTAFVCRGRTVRRQTKPCRVCGKESTKLCDFPTRGARNKTTCDAPLCDGCAVSIGPDSDLCPTHAKFWKAI